MRKFATFPYCSRIKKFSSRSITAEDKVFALRDKCPHKGGQLSQGIVHGDRVACPLHDWKIGLDNGAAVAPDEGCAASFPIKMEGETIMLSLTPNKGCPNK